jgi:hypothetical protein
MIFLTKCLYFPINISSFGQKKNENRGERDKAMHTSDDLSRALRIYPPNYPENKELLVKPGDLSTFAPYGNGVYGYQNRISADPFTSAPPQEPNGGVIYFDNDVERDDFFALMRIMGVQKRNMRPDKQFAAFVRSSTDPGREGYLSQMRIVSRFGLQFMYGAIDDAEYRAFHEQPLAMEEALWIFIATEKSEFGTSFGYDWRNGLGGVFGGDGNYAREELSFGFMIENGYHDVYRVWSRAWLVTK